MRYIAYMKYDIFISYRTSENRHKAEHLFTLLDYRYSGRVSYDKESFEGGRWDKQILNRIDNCKDVIVLLSPQTFANSAEDDAQKYKRWASMATDEVLEEVTKDSKADILRTEISRAIAKGKNIVPVVHTPSGSNFSEWYLPSDIAALKRFEGVLYNDDDPNQLMNSLVPKITRLLKTKKHNAWVYVIITLIVLALSILSLLKIIGKNDSWEKLSQCTNKECYDSMLGSPYADVARAAQDSIDEFKRLARDFMFVNVVRKDSVAVAWSPDVSLLQLRKIGGLLDSMMLMQKGEFMMGDKIWEDIDGPMHKVAIAQNYYMSKYELTRDVWFAVMFDSVVNENPRHPITNVSFFEVQDFVKEINAITQLHFSLPTEAEWEYAAKGNTQYVYAGGDDANGVAFWAGNSHNRVHPVGSLSPNNRDLYDMSGNVSEWCLDEKSDRRAIRGGNITSEKDDLRVGHPDYFKATDNSDVIGFRLILKQQQ